MKPCILCFSAGLLLAVPSIAFAGDPPAAEPGAATDPSKPADAPAGSAGASVEAGATVNAGADATADPNAKKPENADEKYGRTDDGSSFTPAEKTKFYLGARFRDFIVPGFMFDLFVDGGPSVVNVFSGGPELAVQMGALEAIVSITVPYADYSMNDFLFKSKDDPDQAYEIVSSSLKLITASVDLLGRIKLEKRGTVALLIGGGVGISGVIGDIRRTQAYPDDPNNIDPEDPAKWHKCREPGDPQGASTPDGVAYCGNDNDHYPDSNGEDFTEDSWVDGGSKPIIFPYVALPHIALEVTPIEQFMVRVDTGFSITGFFVGLAAGGKLPI
ncbi:MAG: hypothetical protein HOW73_09985 [Polyangiaceae bacterium]|nr:hypothetical protein [Polyangiaceae bacterium]